MLASVCCDQSSVLDLGIAEGPFLPTLSVYFKSVVGVDMDFRAIETAKRIVDFPKHTLHNISLSVANGYRLPFKTDSFDLLFCLEVIEHVSNTKTLLSEISRVLKPNGIFVCSVPIEIGVPLLLRHIAGKVFRFLRDKYSAIELMDGVLGRNLETRRLNENLLHSHRFFDWKKALQAVEKRSFKCERTVYSPFRKVPFFSTIVISRFRNIKKKGQS